MTKYLIFLLIMYIFSVIICRIVWRRYLRAGVEDKEIASISTILDVHSLMRLLSWVPIVNVMLIQDMMRAINIQKRAAASKTR